MTSLLASAMRQRRNAEAGEASEGDERAEAGVTPGPDAIDEAVAHCHVHRKIGVATCSLPPWDAMHQINTNAKYFTAFLYQLF